jgi:hypothetical protein
MTQTTVLEHQEQEDEPLREPDLNQQQQQWGPGHVDAMFTRKDQGWTQVM